MLYSVVATFAAGHFSAGLSGARGARRRYFEAGGVITVLVLMGQVLELRAREATSARSARSSISRPRPRAASRTTAATKRFRSTNPGRR